MRTFNKIPQSDAAKVLWIMNFANKLPLYSAKYGIAAAAITDIQQGSAHFSYYWNMRNQMEEYVKKLTSYKNEIRDGIRYGATPSTVPTVPSFGTPPPVVAPGVFDRAIAVAKGILNAIGYTVADGRDLGIEDSETTVKTTVDINRVKPVLKVELVDNGDVLIGWTKKTMDAIEIYVNRGDGEDFQFLAYDAHPDYLDVNNLEPGESAVWQYKAVYLKHDRQVGVMSEIYQITVTGKNSNRA
jgi:hypothetical protein